MGDRERAGNVSEYDEPRLVRENLGAIRRLYDTASDAGLTDVMRLCHRALYDNDRWAYDKCLRIIETADNLDNEKIN